MKVTFKGKEIEVSQVQPGVVQKSASIFYVRDCDTKEWLYCSPARLEKLNEKHNGDLSQYRGRASAAQHRETTKAAKPAKAAKASMKTSDPVEAESDLVTA